MNRGGGGLAASVTCGLLPRLVGSDLSIYPPFGIDYLLSRQDCVLIAERCRRSWGYLRPMMPAVGGRIRPERLVELGSALGKEMIFIFGGRIQQSLRVSWRGWMSFIVSLKNDSTFTPTGFLNSPSLGILHGTAYSSHKTNHPGR